MFAPPEPQNFSSLSLEGWVPVHKPEGWTSFDVIRFLKRQCKNIKIGHAGTLDPFATGVLLVGFGRAVRLTDFAMGMLKTYRFTIQWGEARDTDDVTGSCVEKNGWVPDLDSIQKKLPLFLGHTKQTPPLYSAVWVQGQRAYALARKGESTELRERSVYIKSLEVLEHTSTQTILEMTCGKGVYVRSVTRDLAATLGTFAYTHTLCRTQVGGFSLDQTLLLENVRDPLTNEEISRYIKPACSVLDDIPAIVLSNELGKDFLVGKKLSLTQESSHPEGFYKIFGGVKFLGIAIVRSGLICPKVVFC